MRRWCRFRETFECRSSDAFLSCRSGGWGSHKRWPIERPLLTTFQIDHLSSLPPLDLTFRISVQSSQLKRWTFEPYLPNVKSLAKDFISLKHLFETVLLKQRNSNGIIMYIKAAATTTAAADRMLWWSRGQHASPLFPNTSSDPTEVYSYLKK